MNSNGWTSPLPWQRPYLRHCYYQSINYESDFLSYPTFFLCYFPLYSETHNKIATALELDFQNFVFSPFIYFACTRMMLGWARDSSVSFAGILFLSNVPITNCELSWNAKYYIETRIYLLFCKQNFACGFSSFFFSNIFLHFSATNC